MAALTVGSIGCKRKDATDEPSKKEQSSAAGASLVEVFERGSVAWNVSANGEVKTKGGGGPLVKINIEDKGPKGKFKMKFK